MNNIENRTNEVAAKATEKVVLTPDEQKSAEDIVQKLEQETHTISDDTNKKINEANDNGTKLPPEKISKWNKITSGFKKLFSPNPEKLAQNRADAEKNVLKHPAASINYAEAKKKGRGDEFLDATIKSFYHGNGLIVKYNPERDSYESIINRGKTGGY